jgi:hypothetical protein
MINRTVGFTPDKNRNVQRKALDTLFCHPHADTPLYIGNLYFIAWRLILTEFYQLHYDEERPAFDEERAYSIFQRTLERYTILALAKAHRTRAIMLTRERNGSPPTKRLLRRTNLLLGPLIQLDEEGRLTKSPHMERRLALANIAHVGKHVPTASRD